MVRQGKAIPVGFSFSQSVQLIIMKFDAEAIWFENLDTAFESG